MIRKSIWVLLAVVATATAAFATSVVVLTDEQVFSGAETVVRGRVTATDVREFPGTPTPVITQVTVKAAEYLKGAGPADVAISVPGGRTIDGGVVIPGTPVFEVGDEVVVALDSHGDRLLVRGFFQGRFTVLNPGEKGETWLVRDPWKNTARSLAACTQSRASCLEAVPGKVTLSQIRTWGGSK